MSFGSMTATNLRRHAAPYPSFLSLHEEACANRLRPHGAMGFRLRLGAAAE